MDTIIHQATFWRSKKRGLGVLFIFCPATYLVLNSNVIIYTYKKWNLSLRKCQECK